MRIRLALAALAMACGPALAQSDMPTENHSALIVAGNVFQVILPAAGPGGVFRKSVTIQNNNVNTDSCWIFIGAGAATKGTSIILTPGGSYQRYYPYVPSDVIQATCATNSDTIYVDTQ